MELRVQGDHSGQSLPNIVPKMQRATRTTLKIHKEFPSSVQQSTGQSVCMKILPETGAGETSERNREQCTQRAGNSDCSDQQEKFTNYGTLGRIFGKVLSESCEIISPMWNTLLDPPNKS